MKSIQLLQQNLAIEYDLQNFIAFIHESVQALGGNVFTSAVALVQFTQEPPIFGTALDISGWRKTDGKGRHDQRRPD